jgi:hypothetical protein
VALPDDAVAFLRTRESEAELPIMKNRGVEIGKLSFGHTRSGEKGSIDNAYRQALFASSYTPAYYTGFIDSTGGTSVAFDLGATVDLTTTVHTSEEAATRPWLIASLAGGAGALLVSGVTLGLALKAKSDFDHTSVQRTARDANTRFVQYRAAAVASGIVALGCGGLAWWLWPSQPSSPVVGAVSDGNGVMLTWQGSW